MGPISRRTLLAGATVAAGSLALTACGGSESGGGGAKGGALTYWSMWTANEPQAKVIKSALDEFQAATGTTVSVEWQGRKVLDQVTAGLSAGKAPDLVDQSFDKLGPALNKQNALTDLASVWDTKNPDGKPVADVVNRDYLKDMPSFGGDVKDYLFPYTVSTISLFYNAKNPYVTKTPETYEELLAACKKAKAAGMGAIVSDADGIWAAEYWFDYLYNRLAGNGAFTKLTEDKSGASWDAPEVKRVAEQIRQLITEGYMVANYDASQYPAGGNNWAKGKGVFYLTGSWITAETQQAVGAGWQYAGANFPPAGANKDAMSLVPFGFAIPTAAKNVDNAKNFMSFFSTPARMGKIATEAANLTALKQGPEPKGLESVQKILNTTPTRTVFEGLAGEYFAKVFDPVFGDLWLGKTTPDQFVAAGKAAQIQFWKGQG